MDPPPPPPLPNFKDRRTGLLVFGIFEILLGVVCVLFAGLMLLGQTMLARNAGTPMSLRMLAPALLMYLGLAVVFVWLGIGSIQCRRWARALMLILAWCWLSIGIITVPFMAMILPRALTNATQKGAALPPGFLIGIIIIQLLFVSVLLVALPAALVFFYRSPHVKATCEMRDPVRRWTDACPLPVLGVALMLWLGAVMLSSFPIAYRGVMPFFGVLLEGWAGTVFALSLVVLWLWLGRAWYKVQAWGWGVLLVVLIGFSVSNFLTFHRVDITEMYQKMGYPQAQIDLIRQQGIVTNSLMAWSSALWLLPMLGYMFWVKRFFQTPR
jgi:hypothetical protein